MHKHRARPGFERARAHLRGLLAALASELRDLTLAVFAPGRKILHALLHLARQQHLCAQANAHPSAHAAASFLSRLTPGTCLRLNGYHWATQAELRLNAGIWTRFI